MTDAADRTRTHRLPIFIASAGPPWVVELAILTSHRHSSLPVRFVIGDSLGNLSPMADRLKAALPMEVRVCQGRTHAEWLDHWIAECPHPYTVFLDSDLFIRRRCWVSPLVGALDRGAALVSCGIRKREEGVIEPVRGLVTTAMPRPLPWLMAVNVPAVKSTGRSFAYDNQIDGDEILAYDVGGRMLEGLRLGGNRVESLPASYAKYYTHIAGMSWRRHPSARVEPRRWLRARSARVRFFGERARFRAFS